jgi:hypothetical protein
MQFIFLQDNHLGAVKSDKSMFNDRGKKNNPRKGPLPFEKWMLHNHNGQPVRDDNNTIVATTTIYEQRSHLRVAFASAT